MRAVLNVGSLEVVSLLFAAHDARYESTERRLRAIYRLNPLPDIADAAKNIDKLAITRREP